MKRNIPTSLTSLFFIAVITAVLSTGCTGSDENEQQQVKTEETTEKSVEIIVEENSPAIEGARVRITSPNQDSILTNGKDVYINLETENFEPGAQTSTPRSGEIANSGNGQHVHVIVDNKPYMAVYDVSNSVNIGPLEPGPHTVLAFPSRSYHESVKSEDAYDVVNFYVGEAKGEFELTEDNPSVIYSRPKGEYKGQDARKIMLDFYIHKVELGPESYKAKYTISPTGENTGQHGPYSVTIEEWKPAFVYNLPAGKYTVKLELIDRDGNVVDGPFNSTERDISVISE